MKTQRESSFELLRLIAQILIVYYHILLFVVYPTYGLAIYKALWFPLHIGVPLFVLISGFFCIKPSIKGFVKLLGMVFVLQLPNTIISIAQGGGGRAILEIPFFISNSSFWFVRTYVFLYLLSPVVNSFLNKISSKQRLYLLISLFYIVNVVGTIGADSTITGGKNVVTFIFFYVLGDTIRCYSDRIKSFSTIKLLLIFGGLNILVVSFFSWFGFKGHSDMLYDRVFCSYTSPILLFNSLLFFCFFVKMSFKSVIINKSAQASLAIFIYHRTVLLTFISPLFLTICGNDASVFFVLTMTLAFTIAMVLASIVLYQVQTPIWAMIVSLGQLLQKKVDSYINNNAE